MNRYKHFLQKVADELHIRKGNEENDLSFQCRIVYSVMGRMAIASLWDTLEDGALPGDEPVSIVRLKKRIDQIAFGYMELYPELKSVLRNEVLQEIKDEIYQTYLKSGYFYHNPYRIAPCAPCGSAVGNVWLTRGLPLGQEQYCSGLGTYQLTSDGMERLISVEEMFQLYQNSIVMPWRELASDAVWSPFQVDSTVRFLKLAPPFRTGYWSEKPDKGIVSMCMVATEGAPRYYLYQTDGGEVYASPIPEWLLMNPINENANNRLFSNSLLANLGTLPPTKFHMDGQVVSISIEYLYPAMELNLVKLYSWPQSFHRPQSPFSRIMDSNVFLAIRETMENKGYRFQEE